jgi:hypothetical protein
MEALERHTGICSQCGQSTMGPDRVFAENTRRLLLKVVAMIEDRYGLRPINHERKEERTRAVAR